MAFLKVQNGSSSGTLVPLKDTLTIGRGDKVGLKLADQGSSRHHAEIFKMGVLYFIRDTQSRNGTFVNDRKVAEAVLREGDHIKIGDTSMLFLEKDDSPQSRSIRLEDGPAEAVSFRDTVVGFKARTRPEGHDTRGKDLVRRVFHALAAEKGVRAMFQAVVREIGQVLGADRADVLVVDSSGPELQFHSVAAFDTKGDGEVTISRTILTEAAQKGEAILTSNAAADQRFAQAQSIVQGALRSILCVPVIAGGEAAGVLYVCNSQRADAFSREDLELATQISLQLGASLSLLRLFEKREATLRASLQAAVRALAGDAPIHAERAEAVARYARAIAHALGLGPEEANCAWIAGMLHSLEAPPPAESGAEGAGARAAGLEEVRRAIEFQDARHDGSGSPALRGDQIPPLGRVLSLAKEIDRLTREGGPEGKPLSIGEALQKAPPLAGAGFHPDVVQAALVAARNGALLGDPGALDLGP